MLTWWFSNLEGDVDIEGRLLNRYRIWHTFDHVYARYLRRLPDGSIGPGAQIELLEYLGCNPKHKVEILKTFEKLDEEGCIHNPVVRGISLARLEYTFREVASGTLYESALIVPRGRRSWFFRKIIVRSCSPNRRGRHGSKTTSRRLAPSRTSSPTSTAGRSAGSRLRPLPEEVTRASLR